MVDTQHVRDDRALERLAARLRGVDRVAVDTEFLRERTYYPKLCLVQVGTPEVLAVVDPLTVRDMTPLWNVLTGDVELLLHAATQDLEIIQRAAGALPRRVFDTQVAAAFLGWGGSVGLGRLVQRCTGTSLKHSEAYTDWARRPLRPRQIEYALDDVRFLHDCHGRLVAELQERGRLQWVREELELRLGRIEHTPDPSRRWRRVSGARKLRGRRLAALRELATWREREAIRRDVPRKRVVPDRALVEMARRSPGTLADLERIRGLHPKEVQRSGEALLERIAEAASMPEADWPTWPASARRPDPGTEAVVSVLDGFLRQRALDLDLSVRLLGSKSDLTAVAHRETADVAPEEEPELLHGWRYDVAGEDILRVLRGEVALRVGRDGGPVVALETR